MALKRVGIIGWRGMVGSVLMNRMIEEKDFDNIADPVFLAHHKRVKKDQILAKDLIFYKTHQILRN